MWRLICALVLLGSVVPLLLAAQHPLLADASFVRAAKTHLYDAHGPVYLTGLNYWGCMNLAAAPDAGGDGARFEAELDQMAAAGVNHLRLMAGSEGPDSAPFRMRPALQPRAGEWDERLLRGLDRCLVGARQRGMRVTLVLGNTWFWSGGLAQYRAWAHGSAIPYPPAWNISAPPQRSDGFAGWGSYTGAKDGAASYEAYMRYVNGFYEDAPALRLFEKHVLRVLQRTNSLTGMRYVDDPTILAWEPINEPQATSVPDVTDPWHMAVQPNASDAMLHWHARTTALLKRHAPRQLVTSGFEGKQGAWYFKALHRDPNVDFACAHAWPQNWGFYKMGDVGAANIEGAVQFATDYLGNVSSWAQEVGKPVVLEEFGMPRDNWRNAAPLYPYASSAPTTHRDALFARVLAKAHLLYARGAGLVGVMPWAYGGVYRPETQRATAFGVVWAGDPMHEAPGWYSIYDKDRTTLALLREHARQTRRSRPGEAK